MIATMAVLLAAVQADGHEEKDLSAARKAVLSWDTKTWDQALASDATLTLKITGVVKNPDGRGGVVSASVGYQGREEVKSALEALYKDFKPKTEIRVEIIRGHEAVMLGDVTVTDASGDRKTLPVAIHLKFDDTCKVSHMTLAAIDAHSTSADAK